MPDTGPPGALPYPDLDAPADFQADDQRLAEASHTAFLGVPAVRMSRIQNSHVVINAIGPDFLIPFPAEHSAPQPVAGITWDAGIFTFDVAGLYRIDAAILCAIGTSSGAASFTLKMYINGSVLACIAAQGVAALTTQVINRTWRFAVGDQLKFAVVISATSAVNDYIYGSSIPYSHVDVDLIAP